MKNTYFKPTAELKICNLPDILANTGTTSIVDYTPDIENQEDEEGI